MTVKIVVPASAKTGLSGFNFGLAYKDTDAEEANYTYLKGAESVFIGDSAVILSVGKTF